MTLGPGSEYIQQWKERDPDSLEKFLGLLLSLRWPGHVLGRGTSQASPSESTGCHDTPEMGSSEAVQPSCLVAHLYHLPIDGVEPRLI